MFKVTFMDFNQGFEMIHTLMVVIKSLLFAISVQLLKDVFKSFAVRLKKHRMASASDGTPSPLLLMYPIIDTGPSPSIES